MVGFSEGGNTEVGDEAGILRLHPITHSHHPRPTDPIELAYEPFFLFGLDTAIKAESELPLCLPPTTIKSRILLPSFTTSLTALSFLVFIISILPQSALLSSTFIDKQACLRTFLECETYHAMSAASWRPVSIFVVFTLRN